MLYRLSLLYFVITRENVFEIHFFMISTQICCRSINDFQLFLMRFMDFILYNHEVFAVVVCQLFNFFQNWVSAFIFPCGIK